MMKTGMNRSGINEVGKSHLLYATEALVERIPDDFQYQRMVNGDESVNRVIDDFQRTCAHFDFVKRI